MPLVPPPPPGFLNHWMHGYKNIWISGICSNFGNSASKRRGTRGVFCTKKSLWACSSTCDSEGQRNQELPWTNIDEAHKYILPCGSVDCNGQFCATDTTKRGKTFGQVLDSSRLKVTDQRLVFDKEWRPDWQNNIYTWPDESKKDCLIHIQRWLCCLYITNKWTT